MYKALLLASSSSLVGCSSVTSPIAKYQSTTLKNSFENAVSMDVVFVLENLNEDPVNVVHFDYAVLVDGATVYSGLAVAELTLPAKPKGASENTSIEAIIPVVLPRSCLAQKNEVTYSISGSFTYISSNALAQALFESNLIEPTVRIVACETMEVPPVEWIPGY